MSYMKDTEKPTSWGPFRLDPMYKDFATVYYDDKERKVHLAFKGELSQDTIG